MVNQNRASNSEAAIKAINLNEVVFEGMQYSNPGFGSDENPVTAEIAWLLRIGNRKKTKYTGDIFSTVFFPLYDVFFGERKTVGVMRIVVHWARLVHILVLSKSSRVIFLERPALI